MGDWTFAGQEVTWQVRDRHTIRTGLTWGVLLEEGMGEREERKKTQSDLVEREREKRREKEKGGQRDTERKMKRKER